MIALLHEPGVDETAGVGVLLLRGADDLSLKADASTGAGATPQDALAANLGVDAGSELAGVAVGKEGRRLSISEANLEPCSGSYSNQGKSRGKSSCIVL